MRISSNTIYNHLTKSMLDSLENYRQLLKESSSEQRIFKPSDDPQGTSISLDYRSKYNSNQKYLEIMEEAEQRLQATDTALDELNQIMVKMQGTAETMATETVTDAARVVAAEEIDGYIDQVMQLMNTQVNGMYIFSGHQTDDAPYSAVGRVLAPYAQEGNTYTGSLSVSGEFTGEENTSWQVQIVDPGTTGTATYKVSTDGGETWGETKVATTSIELGNGLSLDLDENTELGTGDKFMVQVDRGVFNGDNGKIDFKIGQHASLTTNVTAQEVLEESGFFDTAYKLRNALANNNTREISEALDELDTMRQSLDVQTVRSGTYLNRIELARNSLTSLSSDILESIKDYETPNMYELLTELSNQESSLQTTLSLMAQVFPANLIDYI